MCPAPKLLPRRIGKLRVAWIWGWLRNGGVGARTESQMKLSDAKPTSDPPPCPSAGPSEKQRLHGRRGSPPGRLPACRSEPGREDVVSGSPSGGQQNEAGARGSRHVPQAVSSALKSQPWERRDPASGSPRCKSVGCKHVGGNRGKGLVARELGLWRPHTGTMTMATTAEGWAGRRTGPLSWSSLCPPAS